MDTILGNPSVVASLLSAVIAGSVALFVFAFTQFFSKKREQIQFLTPKLEELYLLLNSLSENNVTIFKVAYNCANGDPHNCEQLQSIEEIDLYGLRGAKQIIMYIRLYFPELSRIHQHLFSAQNQLNNRIWSLNTSSPASKDEIVNYCGQVGHFLRLMESEIIENRDKLVGDYIFPKRYIKTTDKQIKAMPSPPDEPVMA